MRRGLIISVFVIAGVLFSAPLAHAAVLYLVPSFDTVPAGGTFSIDIKIDSGGDAINAAEGEIQFDSNLVEFVNTKIDTSAFGLWLDEPAVGSGGNTITFTGGTPKGIAGGALQIARLTFRARGTGTAQFSFLSGAITASDGKGTNILSGTSGANFALGSVEVTETPVPIVSGAPPTPTPELPVPVQRVAVPATSLPRQPQVRVPLYPDSSKWYNLLGETIALWDVPDDVTRVAAVLDDNPNTEPKRTEPTLTTGKRFGALDEGVWYVHVQFRNNIGWGPVAHYRIALDTTAPLSFEAVIDNPSSDNPTPIITFAAGDSLSGIGSVQVIVDDGAPLLASGSPFTLPPQPPGEHTAIIRVIDRAGNSSEDDLRFEIIPLPTPQISFVTPTVVSGEAAFASGRTIPQTFVDLTVLDEQEFTVFRGEVESDENGNWESSFGSQLDHGNYQLVVVARDGRGAVSYPSEPTSFRIRSAPVLSIGPVDLGWPEIAIILISLSLAGFGGVAWRSASRRSRQAAYETVSVRDIEKLGTMIRKHLTGMKELMHGTKRGISKKMLTEFDMHAEKAEKASDDLNYVTGTMKKM